MSGEYGIGAGDPTVDVGTGGGDVVGGGMDGIPITTATIPAAEAGHIMGTKTVTYRSVVLVVVMVIVRLQTHVHVTAHLQDLIVEQLLALTNSHVILVIV